MNAVRRGAIYIAKAIGGAVDIQRRIQGQCVGFCAVIHLGRDHLDLGYVLQRFVQSDQACSLETVVIGNKYFHGLVIVGVGTEKEPRSGGACGVLLNALRAAVARGTSLPGMPVAAPSIIRVLSEKFLCTLGFAKTPPVLMP